MSAILGIETSTRRTSVAIVADKKVLFDTDNAPVAVDGFDLSALVATALSAAGLAASDLSAIAVDTGPGGLNAVRAGVTFANGLALSLSLPMIPASSLEIMAYQARSRTGLPAICVRGATAENACIAIYDGATSSVPIFGPISHIADRVRNLSASHAVAGRFRHHLIREVASPYLVDSYIDGPTAVAMLSFLTLDKPIDRATAAPIEIVYAELTHQ